MIKERLYALKDRGFQPEGILDIGAHVGDLSLLLKEIWPYANVVSIDANPHIEEELKKRKLNYKIEALSNEIGKEKGFYISKEWALSSGNSFYRENTTSFSNENCEFIKVITNTLDNLFKSGEKFELIKLDTQGSETDILSGGVNLLKNTQYILTEAAVHEYNIGANTITQMFSLMSGLGFELDDICNFFHNSKNILMQVDLLFKRKE